MSLTPSFGGGKLNMANGMHEEFKTVSRDICNGLFSIGENGFGTRRMTSI
uniref:Uncharacterized protein n=1 Tax=Brassica oleracea var. oleracea TaxID=109376 RepID=A0A0D3D211_BRAOL